MIKNKNIYRGMSIKDYMKKRYLIHNSMTVDCLFCKNEYKLNIIKQHLRDCKRCKNIRINLELIDKFKYFDDFIIFNNLINKLKKETIEEYFNNELNK
jgi:hypothetical protein